MSLVYWTRTERGTDMSSVQTWARAAFVQYYFNTRSIYQWVKILLTVSVRRIARPE